MKGSKKMKKSVAIVLTLVFVLVLSITSFAYPGMFLDSPSRNEAPVVLDVVLPNGCTAGIVITPYSERDSLSPEQLEIIEKAYESIKNADNVTELNEEFKQYIENLGIDPDNIAISDLFNIDGIGCENCGNEGAHTGFTITIEADTTNGFVGMLQYVNGAWVFIDNAKVNPNGTVTFKVDNFGPVAIAVDTGAEETPTGDITPWILIALIVVALAGLTIVAVNYKKEKVKE